MYISRSQTSVSATQQTTWPGISMSYYVKYDHKIYTRGAGCSATRVYYIINVAYNIIYTLYFICSKAFLQLMLVDVSIAYKC